MIRIHFSAEDLTRLRVATTRSVMAEMIFGVEMLRKKRGGLMFQWFRRSQTPLSPRTAAALVALYPRDGGGLDLTTLVGDAASIDEAIDMVPRVPTAWMDAELRRCTLDSAPTPWLRSLASRSAVPRLELAQVLREFHQARMAPHWTRVQKHLGQHRSRWASQIVDAGIEAFLHRVSPEMVRWQYPILEVGTQRNRIYDCYLDGRGLVLAPTAFGVPCLMHDLHDPAAAPMLTIPTVHDLETAAGFLDPADPQALPALLGKTRAAILDSTTTATTTKQLADRLGITAAAASQHATALRNAGLITTQRTRSGAWHLATALGIALLDGR